MNIWEAVDQTTTLQKHMDLRLRGEISCHCLITMQTFKFGGNYFGVDINILLVFVAKLTIRICDKTCKCF